jgi:hypothetical protein
MKRDVSQINSAYYMYKPKQSRKEGIKMPIHIHSINININIENAMMIE